MPPKPEQFTYVIGDVHGRIDLLNSLLDIIETDKTTNAGTSAEIVFVGDLADRGDASRAVLETVFEMTRSDTNVHCIMGNHERMLLDFLDKPETNASRWLRNGAIPTLASFGLKEVSQNPDVAQLLNIRNEFQDAIPEGLEDWLRALPLFWQSGTLVVVHGAADPNKTIAEQSEDTLLWGNAAFNRTSRKDGIWVAHGHTVVDPPFNENSRISVDTGAYFSGKLTAAAVSQHGDVRFLSTR